jgi:hypothetical protein
MLSIYCFMVSDNLYTKIQSVNHKTDLMTHVTNNTKNANVTFCNGQYLILYGYN